MPAAARPSRSLLRGVAERASNRPLPGQGHTPLHRVTLLGTNPWLRRFPMHMPSQPQGSRARTSGDTLPCRNASPATPFPVTGALTPPDSTLHPTRGDIEARHRGEGPRATATKERQGPLRGHAIASLAEELYSRQILQASCPAAVAPGRTLHKRRALSMISLHAGSQGRSWQAATPFRITFHSSSISPKRVSSGASISKSPVGNWRNGVGIASPETSSNVSDSQKSTVSRKVGDTAYAIAAPTNTAPPTMTGTGTRPSGSTSIVGRFRTYWNLLAPLRRRAGSSEMNLPTLGS
jgi:hypothetical protein